MNETVRFFLQRMENHSCVVSCHQISGGDAVFEIQRTDGRPAVRVQVSDAYSYGVAEYLSRPRQISSGDFILVAGFAGFDKSLVARAAKDRIGIGQIGKLMGALNLHEIWKYRTQEEKKLAH